MGEVASGVILPNNTLTSASATKSNTSSAGKFFAHGISSPQEPGLPSWDELAAAVALRPELVLNSTRAYVDVSTAAGTWNYGRAFAWPEQLAPKGLREVEVVTKVDQEAFFDMYVKAAQTFINA